MNNISDRIFFKVLDVKNNFSFITNNLNEINTDYCYEQKKIQYDNNFLLLTFESIGKYDKTNNSKLSDFKRFCIQYKLIYKYLNMPNFKFLFTVDIFDIKNMGQYKSVFNVELFNKNKDTELNYKLNSYIILNRNKNKIYFKYYPGTSRYARFN